MAHYVLTPAQSKRIETAFSYHRPKPDTDQAERCESIRGSCKNLAYFLANLCPDGRELNAALKKLEEVQSWAIAAIVRNE